MLENCWISLHPSSTGTVLFLPRPALRAWRVQGPSRTPPNYTCAEHDFRRVEWPLWSFFYTQSGYLCMQSCTCVANRWVYLIFRHWIFIIFFLNSTPETMWKLLYIGNLVNEVLNWLPMNYHHGAKEGQAFCKIHCWMRSFPEVARSSRSLGRGQEDPSRSEATPGWELAGKTEERVLKEEW